MYPPSEPAPIADLEALLATPFGMILMNTIRLAMPPNPSGTPRMPDFREKPLNGDAYRDFMSHRFGPNDDVEAAGAEAKRLSAAAAAEVEMAGSRGSVVQRSPDRVTL